MSKDSNGRNGRLGWISAWVGIVTLFIGIFVYGMNTAVEIGITQANINANETTLELREARFQAIETRIVQSEVRLGVNEERFRNIDSSLARIEKILTDNTSDINRIMRVLSATPGTHPSSSPIPRPIQ